MPLLVKYLDYQPHKRATNRGHAETIIRRALQRDGWKVWRGGFLILGLQSEYERLRNKYQQAKDIVIQQHGEGMWECLSTLAKYRGMPDFFCYHPILRTTKFIECKLGYEQLSTYQRRTLHVLTNWGFDVEVHVVGLPHMSAKTAVFDLLTKRKQVIEKTMKIMRYA